MPRTANQKTKLLYVMEALLRESDEEHPLSMEDLLRYLSEKGIRAERKSVYSDIETLQAFGLDIHGTRGRTAGYYVGERDFELPEIKLLIDSVQSSKFITERKTMQLIRKLAGLTSVHEAALMKRQLFVKNRIKSMNESIYYNVDAIHQAIAEDKQIEFRYYSYTVTKEKKFRRNGRPYRVSPLALSWAEENYYLIAYEGEAGKIKHFRVDKMDGIRVTEKFREGQKLLRETDMAEYTRKNFSMFGGEEQTVTLRFSNRMIGVVIDTFGKDVPIFSVDADHFQIRATVAVSPQFFGWLFGLDGEAVITAPREVMDAFQAQLERVKQGC
ncbi:MAG: WYL domain-containing protein [Clostridia bacterium]|nr:WYL domain-containing protein [Clostridia bacterium]